MLRRTYSHLSQGARPTRKMTNIKNVKRHLRVAVLSHDMMEQLLSNIDPFTQTRDLIVVPRHVLPGLLTALHLHLEHPSKTQLLNVFQRYFYALDLEQEIRTISSSCPHCASLAKLPK